MCDRFTVVDSPEVREILVQLGINYGDYKRLLPLINSGPTEKIPIVINDENTHRIKLAIWWYKLKPSGFRFKPDTLWKTYNARAQKLGENRLYQNAFRMRRCVIPASGFYGYKTQKGKKCPYYIRPRDNAIAFAGLYNQW